MEEFRTGGLQEGGIQERRDTGKEVSGHEGCVTGKMLDRRDTRKVECKTGGMQEWMDRGKDGFRS